MHIKDTWKPTKIAKALRQMARLKSLCIGDDVDYVSCFRIRIYRHNHLLLVPSRTLTASSQMWWPWRVLLEVIVFLLLYFSFTHSFRPPFQRHPFRAFCSPRWIRSTCDSMRTRSFGSMYSYWHCTQIWWVWWLGRVAQFIGGPCMAIDSSQGMKRLASDEEECSNPNGVSFTSQRVPLVLWCSIRNPYETSWVIQLILMSMKPVHL